ncbi:MAG: UDP-N-acetylmuramoyl-tripeptide--D-alanyl-D-alanine ligase [Firmicutes bacterium]|nr:UDP-N-acetylmuramoyl-tripeptide--D-alanyl-D-alanine ligase [Bacillota bacterium]
MKKLTAAQAAVYAEGVVYCGPDDNVADSVERDSRKAGPGSIFVGLAGEINDGNDFAEAAYSNGCRMFLLSRRDVCDTMKEKYSDASVIFVEDTLAGMQKLAKKYLADCDIIKVAVTGSTGKTSTKDMLRCIFESKYRTISNFENYNNHIGVPLTVFNVQEDTEAGIFEMGMNHTGEIEVLADIVRPEIAAITNVGISHIGNLGSRENILAAKLEITAFMDSDSTLVYNVDNDMLCSIAGQDTVYQAVQAGAEADAGGIVISDVVDSGDKGIDFVLTAGGESQAFHIPVPGAHNAWNASLAVGCGLKYGISLADAAEALKNLSISGNRLNVQESHGIKIINDTYNASPDSVKAAIDVLTATKCTRKVALLADMFELGENSDSFHHEVGDYAGEKSTDLVITIGENAQHIAAGAAAKIGLDRVISFADSQAFYEAAHDIIRKGDAILVKGSHGMRMDKVAEYLLKAGAWHE